MSLNATWIIVTEYCSANVCRGNVKQAGPETSRMLTVIISIIIISIIILIIITIIYCEPGRWGNTERVKKERS